MHAALYRIQILHVAGQLDLQLGLKSTKCTWSMSRDNDNDNDNDIEITSFPATTSL